MNSPPSIDSQTLLGQLRTVVSATRHHVSRVKQEIGISAAQLWALTEIVETPGLSSGELAQRMAIHPTTASNLISQLKKRGLVRAKRAAMDGRIALLEASAAGRRLYARAPEPRRGTLAAAIASLHPAERAACAQSLNALYQAVLAQGNPAESPPQVPRGD